MATLVIHGHAATVMGIEAGIEPEAQARKKAVPGVSLGLATTALAELVTSVGDDQLMLPTPCTDYTVGDLVDHVSGLALAFTGAARKEKVSGAEEGGTGDASRLESGWRERITADLASLAEAWREPSAYDGMTVAGPVELPGKVLEVPAGATPLVELLALLGRRG